MAPLATRRHFSKANRSGPPPRKKMTENAAMTDPQMRNVNMALFLACVIETS
jgi:hypothetical protein